MSTERYIVKDGRIYYPFSNIKQVGSVATKAILTARKNGDFESIYDAFSRLTLEGITKKTLEFLILADAFRSFHYNKATLIYNLDSLINYAELTKDLDPSLVMKPEIEIKEEYPIADELQNELTVFGFYLTHHPVAIYKKNYKESIDIVDIPKYFSKRISTLVLIERIKVMNIKL